MSENNELKLTHDIEWSMLDKRRYVPLSLLSTFTVRSLLYPITLVRTRLQVQVQASIYRGTWDALAKTARYEGFRSLYKGFLVYNCQLLPGLIYITTFEATRAHANILTTNEYARAAIGGSIASLLSQSLSCPIDVISQHMQLVGLTSPTNSSNMSSTQIKERQIQRIHVPMEIRKSNYLVFKHICQTLLHENSSNSEKNSRYSLRGFYRGYFISTFLFSVTSSIWWPAYYFYQRQMLKLETIIPSLAPLPVLFIQCIAGPLSSLTSSLITNPLDVCRTRIQVEKERRRFVSILRELWQQEGLAVFTKGLTARLSHSCVYSLFIIFGYETVKRISLKEQYRNHVRW